MERDTLIYQLSNYFNLKELVCPHILSVHGSQSWKFLSTELLHTLLIVRSEIIKKPMILNNYHIQGKITQRGFRCNLCDIPKNKTIKNELYTSAHTVGKAIDFFAPPYSVLEIHKLICNHSELLPYPIRFERGVTHCHLDCYDNTAGVKILYFYP